MQRLAFGDDALRRLQPAKLSGKHGIYILPDLGGGKFPGTDVGIGQSHTLLLPDDRRDVRVLFGGEQLGVQDRAGRGDAHHRAFHQAAPRFGDLFADGDAVPGGKEASEMSLSGVSRHAAHRHLLAPAELAGGEHDLQGFGRNLGIVAEKLIEVAEAKEEQRIGVILFDAVVLLLDRRHAAGGGLRHGDAALRLGAFCQAPALGKETALPPF